MIHFAHAGEQHDTAIEATTHTIATEWYIAIPLFLLVGSALLALTYRLSGRSIPITYAVAILALLGTGVVAYSTIPVLSIVCFTLGFAMTLGQVLLGLGAKNHK